MTDFHPLDSTAWHALGAAAERMLRDRQAADPAAVEAGRLSADAADVRQRVARSLVTLFEAIAQGDDVPELGALHAEIMADVPRAAEAVARISAGRTGDYQLHRYAHAMAIIAHHMQPTPGGAPSLIVCHMANQQLRREAAARPAAPAQPSNPGGNHVNRSAQRAPSATAGPGAPNRGSNSRPGPAQQGLF